MEDYKKRQKINKIFNFLETFPEIKLYKKNYFFSKSVIETIFDFLVGTKKNYRYYPWIKKIREKQKELFGFDFFYNEQLIICFPPLGKQIFFF